MTTFYNQNNPSGGYTVEVSKGGKFRVGYFYNGLNTLHRTKWLVGDVPANFEDAKYNYLNSKAIA